MVSAGREAGLLRQHGVVVVVLRESHAIETTVPDPPWGRLAHSGPVVWTISCLARCVILCWHVRAMVALASSVPRVFGHVASRTPPTPQKESTISKSITYHLATLRLLTPTCHDSECTDRGGSA